MGWRESGRDGGSRQNACATRSLRKQMPIGYLVSRLDYYNFGAGFNVMLNLGKFKAGGVG
eukprot:scaffold3225_cov65-Cyclotella_meneghiniana.AAC.7